MNRGMRWNSSVTQVGLRLGMFQKPYSNGVGIEAMEGLVGKNDGLECSSGIAVP
jgi:hypothetical protein